jgi:hypothetical protein
MEDEVNRQYTIGIDPGTHTGVAVYHRPTERIVDACTVDFSRALEFVEQNYKPDECDLIIEDASLNKPTFRKGKSDRAQDRMARNVGMVQRESRLLIAEFRRRGYRVLAVRPTSGKWNADVTKRVTGYAQRCSQHARDAIALCWGVKVVREELAA